MVAKMNYQKMKWAAGCSLQYITDASAVLPADLSAFVSENQTILDGVYRQIKDLYLSGSVCRYPR